MMRATTNCTALRSGLYQVCIGKGSMAGILRGELVSASFVSPGQY